MAKAIPDRWLNYLPIGQRIAGTRFIAFKVPLRQNVNERVEEEHRLAPQSLLKSVPNLGMIVDLTNTNRYYDPETFTERNVEHQKLMIPGHQTPPRHLAERFCDFAKNFLEANTNNDNLIGVHCTHGVNRTGYLICYYMITRMNILPSSAMKSFADARGHHIERDNYTQSLGSLKQEFTKFKDWRTPDEISEHCQPQQMPDKQKNQYQQQKNRHHQEYQEDRQHQQYRNHRDYQDERHQQQNPRFQKNRPDFGMQRRWQHQAPRETPYSRKANFYPTGDRYQQEGSWRQQSYQQHKEDNDYTYRNYDNYSDNYSKNYSRNSYSTNNYSRNNYSREKQYGRENFDEYNQYNGANSRRNCDYSRESSYNRRGGGGDSRFKRSNHYRDDE